MRQVRKAVVGHVDDLLTLFLWKPLAVFDGPESKLIQQFLGSHVAAFPPVLAKPLDAGEVRDMQLLVQISLAFALCQLRFGCRLCWLRSIH